MNLKTLIIEAMQTGQRCDNHQAPWTEAELLEGKMWEDEHNFDLLARLNDRDIERIIKELEIKDLAIALQGANFIAQEKFLSNMPDKLRQMVEQEMVFMGREYEQNIIYYKKRILAVAKKLTKQREIGIPIFI